jgi:hypothetical protein
MTKPFDPVDLLAEVSALAPELAMASAISKPSHGPFDMTFGSNLRSVRVISRIWPPASGPIALDTAPWNASA